MESDITVAFGIAWRRYRIMPNLSQAALAERAGLRTAAIKSLERGVHQLPCLVTVRLRADALGLDAAQREQLCHMARHVSSSLPTIVPPGVARIATNVPRRMTHRIGRTVDIINLGDYLRQRRVLLLLTISPGRFVVAAKRSVIVFLLHIRIRSMIPIDDGMFAQTRTIHVIHTEVKQRFYGRSTVSQDIFPR